MKVRKLSAILLAGALMATTAVTSFAAEESSQTESTDSEDSTESIVDESGNLKIEGTTVTGVTEQGKEAKEIKIPEGVTKIGDDAFSGCTNLENVDIPDSVTEIGYAAFRFCENLTELVLGNGVVSIGGGVIGLCDNLKSITFGDSLKEIDSEFFADNSSLESINVTENNEYYSSENGVLFNKDKTVLIKYPSAKKDKSYTVPETVTSLKGGLGSMVVAFYGTIDSPYLESITLPEGLKEIPALAFSGSGIKSIIIPQSVTYIGISAFDHCDNLESIVIPDGVTTIDAAAFGACKNLKTVYIPASVTKLGEDIYDVFMMSDNITDIYYSGTEEQWAKIENIENNHFPETATIHYNYVAPTETDSSDSNTSDSETSSDNSTTESTDSETSTDSNSSGTTTTPDTGVAGLSLTLGVIALADAAVVISRKKTH